jgi:hypothetical protein
MTQIEQYLKRASFWLSRRDQIEIIPCLRDALEDQLQATQKKLNRALTDAEVHALIRSFGPPALAASRYKSHSPLIGGALMLVFAKIMTISVLVILCVQLVYVAYAIAQGTPVGTALVSGMGKAVVGASIGFTCTTLVFAWMTRIYMSALNYKESALKGPEDLAE